jgi:hypothetical protein
MEMTIRPFMTTGIALVGASVIAIAPIVPITAPPDITIPASNVSSLSYELTAFPEDLLNALTPLLAELSPAQFLAVLDDLGAIAGAAVNPLFGGLALVVDQLLDGLTGLVDTLLTGLVPVVETLLEGLVPVLETVFAGLVAVELALVPVLALGVVPVVATLLGGLAVVVGQIFSPITPLGLALIGVLGGLFGGLALPAVAATEATAFGAADVENKAAAETFALSTETTAGASAGTLPEQASPVAEVASQTPAEVLTEVQESLPEQAEGAGLETAIENQELNTEVLEPVSGEVDSSAPTVGDVDALPVDESMGGTEDSGTPNAGGGVDAGEGPSSNGESTPASAGAGGQE